MPHSSLHRWVALGTGLLLSLLLTPAKPSGARTDLGTPVLMWEITSERAGTGTLYLLGAAHVGRAAIQGFDDVIEAAFARSHVLALEADMRVAEDPSFGRFMVETGQLADGSKLAERISPQVYARLLRALDQRRLLPAAFDELEPWLVALMLSADTLSRQGYQPRHGMGRYFVERARAKPLVELEGARPQVEALDRLDVGAQQAMLDDTLRHLDDLDAHVQQILALWDSGDADGLAALLFANARASPERERYLEQMYFDRNRRMRERLEAPLRNGDMWFAVVGAGHVVGHHGIPALFAERGYRVRQLRAHEAGVPSRRIAPE